MSLWLQIVTAAAVPGKVGLLCPLRFEENDTGAICDVTSAGIFTCCDIALSYALAQQASTTQEFYLDKSKANDCFAMYERDILPKFLANGKCKNTKASSPLRLSLLTAKPGSCLSQTITAYEAFVNTKALDAACRSGPMTSAECQACGQQMLNLAKSPECLMAAQVYLGSQNTSIDHWNLLSACIQSNFGVPIPREITLPPSPPPPPNSPKSSHSGPQAVPVIVGTSAVGLVVLVLLLSILFWYCYGKGAWHRYNQRNRRANLSKRPKAMIPFKEFTLEELRAATMNFSESSRIGKGGSSDVYQGVLPDGSVVAIKKMLKDTSGEGYAAAQFVNEVSTYAVLEHENLVKMFGFCQEGEELILVQEYMAYGSLEDALFSGTSKLDISWPLCMHVVLGVARGLVYLHGSHALGAGAGRGQQPQKQQDRVIHRDIKPGNVLLDSSYTVRLADFGVAKSVMAKKTHVTTKIMGTFGYLAPEYASTGKLTDKSDVYSFGVLVLVTVSKRQPVDSSGGSNNGGIVPSAFKLARDNHLLDLVHSSYRGQYTPDQAERLLLVGLLCVQPDPQERPFMQAVLEMLEGTADVPEVPIPTIQSASRLPGLQRLHTLDASGSRHHSSGSASVGTTTDSKTFSPESEMFTEWEGSGDANRNNDSRM